MFRRVDSSYYSGTVCSAVIISLHAEPPARGALVAGAGSEQARADHSDQLPFTMKVLLNSLLTVLTTLTPYAVVISLRTEPPARGAPVGGRRLRAGPRAAAPARRPVAAARGPRGPFGPAAVY